MVTNDSMRVLTVALALLVLRNKLPHISCRDFLSSACMPPNAISLRTLISHQEHPPPPAAAPLLHDSEFAAHDQTDKATQKLQSDLAARDVELYLLRTELRIRQKQATVPANPARVPGNKRKAAAADNGLQPATKKVRRACTPSIPPVFAGGDSDLDEITALDEALDGAIRSASNYDDSSENRPESFKILACIAAFLKATAQPAGESPRSTSLSERRQHMRVIADSASVAIRAIGTAMHTCLLGLMNWATALLSEAEPSPGAVPQKAATGRFDAVFDMLSAALGRQLQGAFDALFENSRLPSAAKMTPAGSGEQFAHSNLASQSSMFAEFDGLELETAEAAARRAILAHLEASIVVPSVRSLVALSTAHIEVRNEQNAITCTRRSRVAEQHDGTPRDNGRKPLPSGEGVTLATSHEVVHCVRARIQDLFLNRLPEVRRWTTQANDAKDDTIRSLLAEMIAQAVARELASLYEAGSRAPNPRSGRTDNNDTADGATPPLTDSAFLRVVWTLCDLIDGCVPLLPITSDWTVSRRGAHGVRDNLSSTGTVERLLMSCVPMLALSSRVLDKRAPSVQREQADMRLKATLERVLIARGDWGE